MGKDIRLHAIVIGVWERLDYTRALLFQLANQGWQVPLFLDSLRLGTWASYRTCLHAVPADATHFLVMQEDILVCLDFKESVEAVIHANPNNMVSLFGTRKIANEVEGHWYIQHYSLMAQAIVWPVAMTEHFLQWTEKCMEWDHDPITGGDDYYIAAYSMKVNPQWRTTPSLVEHIGFEDSSMGFSPAPGGNPRVASRFIGADQSGLNIDWTIGVNDPPADRSGAGKVSKPYVWLNCDE